MYRYNPSMRGLDRSAWTQDHNRQRQCPCDNPSNLNSSTTKETPEPPVIPTSAPCTSKLMTHSFPVAATSRTVARLVPYQKLKGCGVASAAAAALLLHGWLCTVTLAASRNFFPRMSRSSCCLVVKW